MGPGRASFGISSKQRASSDLFVRSAAQVALLVYFTVVVVGIWAEARHSVDRFQRRDPGVLVDTTVDERFVTPAWWSKALTGYRFVVALALLAAVSGNEPSPWALRMALSICMTGLVLEGAIFGYLLAERYVLGCNTCTYSPNTCHGRDWCHRCSAMGDEFPAKCSNVGPMTIPPPRGRSLHWRRRAVVAGACVVVLALNWALIYQAKRLATPVTNARLRRDMALAQKLQALALFGCFASVVVAWVRGAAALRFPRFAWGEHAHSGAQRTHDSRFGLLWWASVGTLVAGPALAMGVWVLFMRGKRIYEMAHLGFLTLAIAAFAFVIAVCTLELYTCNESVRGDNSCNDKRFCCAHGSAAVPGPRCAGFDKGCPLGAGSPVLVQGPGQLHADRGFQIMFISSGWALFFAWHAFIGAQTNFGARSRLRDAARVAQAA